MKVAEKIEMPAATAWPHRRGVGQPLSTESSELQGPSPRGILRHGFAEKWLRKDPKKTAARALLGWLRVAGFLTTLAPYMRPDVIPGLSSPITNFRTTPPNAESFPNCKGRIQ